VGSLGSIGEFRPIKGEFRKFNLKETSKLERKSRTGRGERLSGDSLNAFFGYHVR